MWMRQNEVDAKSRDVRLLLCPADTSVCAPATFADGYVWDSVDLEHPGTGLCSYAGRDFVRCPIQQPDTREVVGACLHHPGGALVARADGTVEFLTLKDLCIASDADKSVGPDSKSPVLRVLR